MQKAADTVFVVRNNVSGGVDDLKPYLPICPLLVRIIGPRGIDERHSIQFNLFRLRSDCSSRLRMLETNLLIFTLCQFGINL